MLSFVITVHKLDATKCTVCSITQLKRRQGSRS